MIHLLSPESVVPESAARPVSSAHTFRAESVDSLSALDAARWDALVPRDTPHLRYNFLQAVEASGQGKRPRYIRVVDEDTGELVAVAVAYGMPVDLLTLVPRRYITGILALRRRIAPRLFFLPSLTCGPVVTNCCPNLFLSPLLWDESPADYETVAGMLIDSLEAVPGAGPLHLFFEFPEPYASRIAPVMAARGYLQAPSLPGTRLPVHWRSLDGYVASLRKAFRRTVLKDRQRAADITFEVTDDFRPYAADAWALYKQVLDKADFVFEELSRDFLEHLAGFEQARMVIARDASGKLVGMELLMCGDTVLQDIYTGVDYSRNADNHLYFNLLYPVLDYAGRQGMETLSLGQTSYTFKARLGVTPYPTYLFVKHRSRLVHSLLVRLRSQLFPVTPTMTYQVFRREDGTEKPGEAAAQKPNTSRSA